MLRIDHSAAAAAAGLQLKPLLLLLFGDPKVGTSLMQEKATAGIDLPLKLLVWETEDGAVWTGYNRSRPGSGTATASRKAQPTIAKMDQLLHHLMVVASGRTRLMTGRCFAHCQRTPSSGGISLACTSC